MLNEIANRILKACPNKLTSICNEVDMMSENELAQTLRSNRFTAAYIRRYLLS